MTVLVGPELHEISVTVARMEGKLDGTLALGVDHEARIRKLEVSNAHDHEARIRKLEHALWLAAGAGAAAGGGVAAIMSQLTGG